MECPCEDIELPGVPDGGFVSRVPVGLVLAGNGVKGDPEFALDILDVTGQIGGVTGVGAIGGAGSRASEGGGTVQTTVGAAAVHAVIALISGWGRPLSGPDSDVGVDRFGQGHGARFGVPGRAATGIRRIDAGPHHGKSRMAVGVIHRP